MRNKSTIMMFLIMLLIFAVGIFYLGRRTAYIFECRPLYFYMLYALVIFAAIGIMMAGMNMKTLNPLTHCLLVTSDSLVGVLLYMLLVFAVVDFVHFFAQFSPKTFGTIAFSATFIVSALAFVIAAVPRVKTTDIHIKNIREPLKIVHLSDIHLGHFRGKSNLEKIVRLTNEQNPDFVVITGDLFESEYCLDAATLEPLKKIRVPIYFVDGNHDIYTNDAKVKRLASEAGVRVLVNDLVEESGIQLIGLDYMDADENSTEDIVPHEAGSRTIRNTMPEFETDKSRPVIVLHHAPIGGKFIADAGADLFLAGHTHGGQLFPLTLINDRLFEFNRGLYSKYGMQIYVSCGSGTFGPPMRLGTLSEVAVLNLLP